MRILYCGLSGVGKDSLLKASGEFLVAEGVSTTSFGDEMLTCARRVHTKVERDDLKHLPIDEQRQFAARAIDSIAHHNGRLLVNTHIVIEGVPVAAQDSSMVAAMQVNGIVCVTASPDLIIGRRAADDSRQRLVLSCDQVEELQGLQYDMALSLGQTLGIGVDFVDNSICVQQGARELQSTLTNLWRGYEN